MTYFNYSGELAGFKYEDTWADTVKQIQSARLYSKWPSILYVTKPIEAKALHVFTFASRFLRVADSIVQKSEYWHRVFVETSTLLYPIVEMIGSAVGEQADKKLVSGIYWLCNPNELPSTKSKPKPYDDTTLVERMKRHMTTKPSSAPTVKQLYQLRNYYLHGLGLSFDKKLPVKENPIDAALPRGMAWTIEECLHVYWENLIADKGVDGWLQRLAQAEIYPFKIDGSNGFEHGLVDPDIVDRITQNRLRDDRQ